MLHRLKDEEVATLYGGDIGWEEPKEIPLANKITVKDPQAMMKYIHTHIGLTLSPDELMWLTACLMAIGRLYRPRGQKEETHGDQH